MPEIKIHYNNETRIIHANEGLSLLEFLHKHGFYVESPCNGNGTCGKCRIFVHNKNISYTSVETRILTEDEMHEGVHLSCQIKIQDDVEITLPDQIKNASILTDINEVQISGGGVIKKHTVNLPEPSINDQRPDDERLIEQINVTIKATNEADLSSQGSNVLQFNVLSPDILQTLPNVIRQTSYKVTVIEMLDKITGVEAGDTTNILYGVAVDIGTTTIAAYLYELNEKKPVAVESMLNPQQKYGADVISRIDYSTKNSENSIEITNIIRKALSDLVNKLVTSTGNSISDIYLVTMAGNTTMLHILLGLPCRNIAVAPFIPVTLSGHILKPEDIDMKINKAGRVFIMPSVSAYIGADTVAAIISTGLHRTDEIALLVDIGTNGEIALGNKTAIYTCSTAAGPAFEGANIYNGTGGVDGAISEVSISDDREFQIKTIGGYKPIGICGSGLVDAVSCMLKAGIVDETGRILDTDELPEDALIYEDRIVTVNGQQAFTLVPAKSTKHGRQIIITQKDIREIQSAKAAIAAGIHILIKESGYGIQDIQRVFLAGGFGNYMRIENAIMIGLLPHELSGKIYAVGNAAGAGAINSLLSEKEYTDACLISGKTRYIELSANADFVSNYTENMLFDIYIS